MCSLFECVNLWVSLFPGPHHLCKVNFSPHHTPPQCLPLFPLIYAVVPSLLPFFPREEKSWGIETLYKRHKEEDFAETFEVFSPFSVLRNVIHAQETLSKEAQTSWLKPDNAHGSFQLLQILALLPWLFVQLLPLCPSRGHIYLHTTLRLSEDEGCHFGPRSTHLKTGRFLSWLEMVEVLVTDLCSVRATGDACSMLQKWKEHSSSQVFSSHGTFVDFSLCTFICECYLSGRFRLNFQTHRCYQGCTPVTTMWSSSTYVMIPHQKKSGY